ncbi:MAG TPA: SAM-dependent methyltransferase [Acidimicrobiia bacterium]|nr:SAM-dependent methyltransferase [Acidimicrobiia bacterium]
MELALYGPEGYFMAPILRSEKAGDFLTSPEVSPLFGQTLAGFVAAEQQRIGPPFSVVEVGAGSGSLLRPLLESVRVETWAVEVSPPAREVLSALLPRRRVVESLAEVPRPLRGVIIANELLDNLPMAMAQLTAEGWRERWVTADGEGLEMVDRHPRPEVRTWLDRFAGPVDEGGWVEVQLAATAWVAETVTELEGGSLLVVDYGDLAVNLAPRRRDGTLRTYRAHHLGPHPLAEPGATDITADVNFSAMMAAAEAAGAEVELLRQDDFLAAWGLRDILRDLRHRELEAAGGADHMARLALRSRVAEAETLLHPRGLGDFRVLIARK